MFEIQIGVYGLYTLVQHPLTGMAVRRMTEIMSQCDSLDQIDIKIKSTADDRGNVVNVDYMFDPRADMIVNRIEEYLSLMAKPSERLGEYDPSEISLIRASYNTRLFGNKSASRVLSPHGEGRKCLLPLITDKLDFSCIPVVIYKMRFTGKITQCISEQIKQTVHIIRSF